ncbi:MAG: TatD family hydrolase [Fimbriimonadaceae bacterium]|nr:TatD family hydrolase [Fimbriimonadaceae bacterium]
MIDTHCHLNDAEAFPAPTVAIEAARAAGVEKLIVIGVDADSSQSALGIADDHPGVFASVGWHPNYAQAYSAEGLESLRQLSAKPKVVALGEMGLDFHWSYATRAQQEACLFAQLEMASDFDLPIVLHCREAYPELLDILERQPSRRWIFHCFSGGADDALRAVDLGCWFGVDGPITYKKADSLREIVKKLPRDKILIETDSPWMAPHPHRGKPNAPALLPLINAGLAALWGVSPEESDRQTSDNAAALFGFD